MVTNPRKLLEDVHSVKPLLGMFGKPKSLSIDLCNREGTKTAEMEEVDLMSDDVIHSHMME